MSDKPPAKQQEEEDELDDAKKTQSEANQYLQEETPEIQMGSTVLQFISGLGLIHISHRADVINSIAKLQDKRSIMMLLHKRKILDPSEFKKVQNLINNAENEFAKQGKRRGKGKKVDSVSVGASRWKITMTRVELDRYKEAYKSAQRTHQIAYGETIKGKITATTNEYKLDRENELKLKREMAKWLKKNPRRSIDDYLVIEGRRIATDAKIDKNTIDEGQKKLTGEKVKGGQTKGELYKVEEQVAQNHLDDRRSTGKQIQNILEPPSPQPQQVPQQSAPTPSVSVPTLPSNLPSLPSLPAITPKTTSVPGASQIQSKLLPFLQTTAFITAARGALARTLINLRNIKFIGRPLAKMALSFARSALPIMFKTASTVALTAAGAAASLGVTLAAQLGLALAEKIPIIGAPIKATKDTVWGVAKGALVIAGLIIVAICIPVLFVLFQGTSTIQSYGAKNAMSLSLSNTRTKLSWMEFEKQLFGTSQPKLSQKK